eukprot:s1166_g7.t1
MHLTLRPRSSPWGESGGAGVRRHSAAIGRCGERKQRCERGKLQAAHFWSSSALGAATALRARLNRKRGDLRERHKHDGPGRGGASQQRMPTGPVLQQGGASQQRMPTGGASQQRMPTGPVLQQGGAGQRRMPPPGLVQGGGAGTALSLQTKPKMQAEEQQLSAFREWLKQGSVDLRGVRLRRSPLGGLGLFAARDFEEGDVIFEVPRKLCIEVATQNFDVSDEPNVLWRAAQSYDVDAFLDPLAKKAVLSLSQRLLLERQEGAISHFAEYLAVLPDPPSLHPLQLRWPNNLVLGSALLSRMHSTILERDTACMEELLAFERVWKGRLWALSTVWTRAVHLVDGDDTEKLALVPLMDFMNHWTLGSGTTETWSCFYEVRPDGDVAVLAERPISKGEELTFLYGEFSDAQLLCNYGICPDMPGRNAWDEAPVSIGPYVLTSPAGATAPEGSLVATRAACLSRHGWTLEGSLIFTVPQDLRPSGGLLALARLLSLETVEELQEMEDRIFWMDTPGFTEILQSRLRRHRRLRARRGGDDRATDGRGASRGAAWGSDGAGARQRSSDSGNVGEVGEVGEKIVEIGAPYGKCIFCQMDCCGTPIIASEWEDESKNEPLKEMRTKFPQYTFTFKPQWVGMGKHANWQHVLQITNAPTAAIARLQRYQRRQGKVLGEEAWRKRQMKMKQDEPGPGGWG